MKSSKKDNKYTFPIVATIIFLLVLIFGASLSYYISELNIPAPESAAMSAAKRRYIIAETSGTSSVDEALSQSEKASIINSMSAK